MIGLRPVLMALSVVRLLLAVLAIPLAPALYRDHFVVLVLMRPTKEVFLAAGFLMRDGDVSLPPVVVAAIPLFLPGVWLFYFLAQAYSKEISDAKLPWIAGRILPAARIKHTAAALKRVGARFVFLGRLAAFPSSVVAAASGVARISLRDFLVADALGALTSLAIVLGAGYLLGEAHDEAGPWLTAAGVVVLAGIGIALGRYLRSASGD